jgi:hypothetical protein
MSDIKVFMKDVDEIWYWLSTLWVSTLHPLGGAISLAGRYIIASSVSHIRISSLIRHVTGYGVRMLVIAPCNLCLHEAQITP